MLSQRPTTMHLSSYHTHLHILALVIATLIHVNVYVSRNNYDSHRNTASITVIAIM